MFNFDTFLKILLATILFCTSAESNDDNIMKKNSHNQQLKSYDSTSYVHDEDSCSNHPPSADSASINVAVFSKNHVKVQPLKEQPGTYDHRIPIIQIKSGDNPLTVKFLTKSSSIRLEQYLQQHNLHQVEPNHHEIEELPILLKQTVKKPVHQEVHEIIIPTRKIVQEIRPVHEVIKTVVAVPANQHQGEDHIQATTIHPDIKSLTVKLPQKTMDNVHQQFLY